MQVENGELILGGVGAKTLAKEYGTPLYVMDENVIRSSMRAFRSSMEEIDARRAGQRAEQKSELAHSLTSFRCMYTRRGPP